MIYLHHTNYYVNDKKLLCNTLRGFSFVFFTSKNCGHCISLMPEFNNLAKMIQGCVFAKLNVEEDGQAIRLTASRSATPINYVPLLVLYANGIPIGVYQPDEHNPKSNFDKMKNFLLANTQSSNKVKKECGKAEGPRKKGSETHPIKVSSCSIGRPGNRSASNYYNFGNAYRTN